MIENFSAHWAYMVAFAVSAGLVHTAWNKWRQGRASTKNFFRLQDALHAAHIVCVTREATENLFRENPEETFSAYRGKLMLAHHCAKYEDYLRAIGMEADINGFHDAYWAQLKKLEREGGKLRELPSLPPASSRKHQELTSQWSSQRLHHTLLGH